MSTTRLLAVFLLFSLLSSCEDNLISSLPDPSTVVIDKIIDSSSVYLKYGQEAFIENKIILIFEDVVSDSRCPGDVICVWAGDGSIQIKLKNSKEELTAFLHTTLSPKETIFYGYRITLKELSPYPKSTERINKEDYGINLVIKR